MLIAAHILFGLLVVLAIAQGLLVIGFVAVLLRRLPGLPSDEECPKAAVVLCLRGADPFLEDCVRAVLRQDYPDYIVRIVVDSPDDPAWAVVAGVLESEPSPHAHLDALTARQETCSLKCSSVVQVVSQLDESFGFFAQLDADTIPHATWLRELAAALADDRVGAATGNRWYMPLNPSLGALVRYAWNAAAVVQMYWYGIAWGGTLAVKSRVLRDTDVMERWSKAFCEDTMLYTVLKSAGLRVAFAPSLVMINREDCDLGGFFRWVRRQLLTARLYHPAWWAVIGHGVLTSCAPLLAVVLAICGWFNGDSQTAWWSLAGLVVYQTSVSLMLPPIELAVRGIAKARSESTAWLSPVTSLKCVLVIPVTAVVYSIALGSACLLRNSDWRGISYRVEGPWQIRMLEYRPFQAQTERENRDVSL